jgi:hypothetical protein
MKFDLKVCDIDNSTDHREIQDKEQNIIVAT